MDNNTSIEQSWSQANKTDDAMMQQWRDLQEEIKTHFKNEDYDEAVTAILALDNHAILGTDNYIKDSIGTLLEKSPEHFVFLLEELQKQPYHKHLIVPDDDKSKEGKITRMNVLKWRKIFLDMLNEGKTFSDDVVSRVTNLKNKGILVTKSGSQFYLN